MAQPLVTRRAALASAAAVACAAASGAEGQDAVPRAGLGVVVYCRASRRKQMAQDGGPDLFEPLAFLKHCHAAGAGGMQIPLGVLPPERARALRDYAEKHGLFIDGVVSPPRDEADLPRFEAETRCVVEVGALAARTVVMPGRRYEQFATLADARAAEARARRMLELAAPVVTKLRARLAVENHKDQRIEDRLALHKHLDCEYIGACVDTGNSFALMDDPYEAVEALAPLAFTVHLKDQALAPCPDGLLLADVPLGQGAFDLPRMVASLKRAQPKVRLALELITRDPLRVPCLTEQYWTTLPGVPASDLARALRYVRDHPAERLPSVGSLPLERQVELEDAQVAASLRYARERLGL